MIAQPVDVRLENGTQLIAHRRQLGSGERQSRPRPGRPRSSTTLAHRRFSRSSRACARLHAGRRRVRAGRPLDPTPTTSSVRARSVARDARGCRPPRRLSTKPYCEQAQVETRCLARVGRRALRGVIGPTPSSSIRSNRSGCASARSALGSVIRTKPKISLTSSDVKQLFGVYVRNPAGRRRRRP